MTRSYLVVYEKGTGNWSGFAPDIPGCGSAADSLEEMRANLLEALEFHLEGNAEDGLMPPEAASTGFDFKEVFTNDVEYCVVEWLEVRLPAAISFTAPQAALPSATQDQTQHG